MSDNKKTSAEEFTKEVSPTKDGIRQQLFSYGFLKHIHNWLDRFADLKTKNLQDDFAQQKIANTILAEQNINCCNRIIELKNELRQCKELANIQNKKWAERNEILQSKLTEVKSEMESYKKLSEIKNNTSNECFDKIAKLEECNKQLTQSNETKFDLAKEIQNHFENNKDWSFVLQFYDITRVSEFENSKELNKVKNLE